MQAEFLAALVAIGQVDYSLATTPTVYNQATKLFPNWGLNRQTAYLPQQQPRMETLRVLNRLWLDLVSRLSINNQANQSFAHTGGNHAVQSPGYLPTMALQSSPYTRWQETHSPATSSNHY